MPRTTRIAFLLLFITCGHPQVSETVDHGAADYVYVTVDLPDFDASNAASTVYDTYTGTAGASWSSDVPTEPPLEPGSGEYWDAIEPSATRVAGQLHEANVRVDGLILHLAHENPEAYERAVLAHPILREARDAAAKREEGAP